MQERRAGRPKRRKSITVSREALEHLRRQPVSEASHWGARNVLVGSLRLRTSDDMVLISQPGHEPVAAALALQAEELGIEVIAYVVDVDYASNEPFVERILGHVEETCASAVVMSSELSSTLLQRLRHAGAANPEHRHVELLDVTPAMMAQSMRADWSEAHEAGERLARRMREGTTIEISTAMGTAASVRCSGAPRWHNACGIAPAGGWARLPGGQLVTSPESIEGTILADGGVWLTASDRLGRSKLLLHFEDGRLAHAQGPDAERLLEALDQDPEGRRVGQLGFGTNPSVLAAIGAPVQDVTMPGLHLVLGNGEASRGEATGTSARSVPVLIRRPDVSVDGDPVLVRGRYARSLSR